MKKIVYAILFMILALALSTNVHAAASFTANDLDFGSSSQNNGQDVSSTLTLTNTGDVDLTLSLTSALPSQYNVRFSQSSVALAHGATTTITVTLFIPTTQASGRSEVLSGINVASTTPALSDNVRTFITTESMLEITKVTIDYDGDEHTLKDGDSYNDKDLKAGISGTIKVYVRNNFNINMDIEDIQIDIQGSGDLDLDDSDDIGDLSDGDKDSVSFDIDIPSDAEDGDDYDIDVDVTGRDENGVLHKDSYTTNIEIQKETHEISIVNMKLTPQTVTCGGKSTLSIEVENTGKHSEDNVQVGIVSDELDIDEGLALGDLDEDDNVRKTFSFNVDSKLAPGDYDITATTYYDVDEDSNVQTATLTVLPCSSGSNTNTGSNSNGNTNGNTNTGSNSNSNNNVEPVVVPPPVIVTSGTQPTYGSASFTDTPAYLALLVAGIVVIAAVLIILLVKFVF